jgi:DNA-binding NarL/FixJ family response regulator
VDVHDHVRSGALAGGAAVSITIPTHTTVMHPSSTAIADASAGLLDRLDLTDEQWQTVRVLAAADPGGPASIVARLALAGRRRSRARRRVPADRPAARAVQAVADGLTYKQAAARMGVTSNTVRTHLHDAYVQLAVATSPQAVLLCAAYGWVTVPTRPFPHADADRTRQR